MGKTFEKEDWAHIDTRSRHLDTSRPQNRMSEFKFATHRLNET